MKIRVSIYSCLLLLLLFSCQKPDYTTCLKRADKLMNVRPDSALVILEAVPFEELKGLGERAYYALLLTQARDKNYLLQTDDSLIQSAVSYYDARKNIPMQARAYYLWGSVLRDKKEYAHAVEKYLIAMEYTKRNADMYLLGRIYGQAGNLYYLQDLYGA